MIDNTWVFQIWERIGPVLFGWPHPIIISLLNGNKMLLSNITLNQRNFSLDSHLILYIYEMSKYNIHLTGASSLPVKNFLINLAATICAGVTAGSFIHGLPAKKNIYIVSLDSIYHWAITAWLIPRIGIEYKIPSLTDAEQVAQTLNTV